MRLHAHGKSASVVTPSIGKITRAPVPREERLDYVAYLTGETMEAFLADCDGYSGLLSPESGQSVPRVGIPSIWEVKQLDYLSDGDVVLLLPTGSVNVLYRRNSYHNTILATERCNSLCLMCTQPPKNVDDSHRVGEILRLLELIDQDCGELGISGGEPTLLGEDLFTIVQKCKDRLPETSIHILTNGRLFQDRAFAQRLARIEHPDLMLGIPLYSDLSERHDYVVQANGAFDETVLGLYNLASFGVAVEIRVVIHALTYERLPQLARFVHRNFPFAAHIALMGMENFGYVSRNIELLWVDPVEYCKELETATQDLALRGINVSIYNHQLCTIPQSIWSFARRSISDWKNIYLTECEDCVLQDKCSGFFHSARKRHSNYIRAFSELPKENSWRPASRTHVPGN